MNDSANRNRKKIKTLYIILTASVTLMIIFAAILLSELYTTGQGRAFYSSLSGDFVSRPAPAETLLNSGPGSPGLFAAEDGSESFVPFIDFDELRETSPNIVAWIQSEGTVINYPLVQGTDNYFYLYHLPDGTSHRMGSIFLDYRNSPDFSDQNIFIYGHHMASGDMFGTLKNYRDQNYFEQHYSMFIFTPTNNFILMLFAGYVIDSSVEILPMSFMDADDFYMYISSLRSRSFFTSDVEVSFGDTLVFLCTCTDGGSNDERLIIVGKLMEV